MTDRIVTEWDCAIAHDSGYQQGYTDGRSDERERIVKWLRDSYLSRDVVDIDRLTSIIEAGVHTWTAEGVPFPKQENT